MTARASVRVDDECSDWFEVTRGVRQGCVLAPLLFNLFFTAVLTVAVERFKADDQVMEDLVEIKCRFDTDPSDNEKRKAKTLVLVRKLWGMLYADDAGVVSRSQASLAKMMEAIVSTSSEFGLTVSEPKTETMHLRARGEARAEVRIEAAGQHYGQAVKFIYLGGCISDDADISVELRRRRARAFYKLKLYGKEVFHRRCGVTLKTRLSLLKSEVTEALLYGCETWTLGAEHDRLLRSTHHHALLRCIGFRKKSHTSRLLAYHEVLARCKVESIETTILRRRLRWAGKVVRMDDSRLPKAMLFGELSDGKRRVGRPAIHWRGGLVTALRHFGIDASTWLTTAADKANWEAEVDAGAQAFMSRWHAGRVTDARARRAAAAAAAAAADVA
jgi:hypothetical protein